MVKTESAAVVVHHWIEELKRLVPTDARTSLCLPRPRECELKARVPTE